MQLVSQSKERGLDKTALSSYYESHHIVPKCLGGSDEEDNLVLFTPREHVIAHRLLWKANPDNIKLMWAYARTINSNSGILNSRQVEKLKEAKIDYMKNRVVTQETKDKISATLKGHKRDRASVEKGAAKLRGVKASKERVEKQTKHRRELIASGWTHSEESRKKIGEAGKGRFVSEEQRLRISATLKGRPIHENTIAAASAYQKSLLPWERSRQKFNEVALERWKNADYYFEFWDYIGRPKHWEYTSKLNKTQGSGYYQGYFEVMVRMFLEGWVPEEDQKWLGKFR